MLYLIGCIGIFGFVLPYGTASVLIYDTDIILQDVADAVMLLDIAILLYVSWLPANQRQSLPRFLLLYADL